jgi:hypothetical protein
MKCIIYLLLLSTLIGCHRNKQAKVVDCFSKDADMDVCYKRGSPTPLQQEPQPNSSREVKSHGQ